MYSCSIISMNDEERSNKNADFTCVRVQHPFLEETIEGEKYTSYEVILDTNRIAFTLPHSRTRRRFSDFLWLRKQLANNEPEMTPPPLPNRSVFRSRFNKAIIEQRVQKLQEFLQKVVNVPVFLGDASLHLFLQTDLPVPVMEACIRGETGMGVLDAVLDYGNTCPRSCSDSGLDLSVCGNQYSINGSIESSILDTDEQAFSSELSYSSNDYPTQSTPATSSDSQNQPKELRTLVGSPAFHVENLTGNGESSDLVASVESVSISSEKGNDSNDSGEVSEEDKRQVFGSLDTMLSPAKREKSGRTRSIGKSLEQPSALETENKMAKSNRRVTFCKEVTVAKVIRNFPIQRYSDPN